MKCVRQQCILTKKRSWKVAQIIRRAAEEMQQANDTLRSALDELGGPAAGEPPAHMH